MASGDDGRIARRWQEMGLTAIDDETAPALLDAILAAGEPHVVAALVDRRALARNAHHLGPLVEGLGGARPAGDEQRPGAVADELRALPTHRRGPRLRRHIAARLARVLGVPGDDVAVERPFRDQGMDSLMAVELRNILSRDLGTPLSATLAFDHPDIASMAAHLGHRLFGAEERTDPVGTSGPDRPAAPTSPLDIDPEIASLSDEEAERLLLEELEGLVANDDGEV
jgi:acyl carrier protein